MNLREPAAVRTAVPTAAHATAHPAGTASIFLAPFDALDDAALLAHYAAPRSVRYEPVADADETRADKIDAVLAGRFELNHETHVLVEPIAWLDNPSADVEWHILLHKFYYAVGLGLAFERSGDTRYAARWAGLIDGWIASTPPGFIAADVTGRRVQNWVYSHHLFVGHAAHPVAVDPAVHTRLLRSLHEQVEYLCAHLTPKRNHRTLELCAIFLAGVVFPEMRRAAHWREFALGEALANIESDLLADGVHCELSTDYHHLALKNHLQVRRLAAQNGVTVPAAFDAALQRALEFSLHVHKPDGSVPSLSDGDARGFPDLLRQGADLYGREDMRFVASGGAQGTPPSARAVHFAASGYSIVRSGWGEGQGASGYADAQYLVFDSGPLGEGNHGHFDCLSFELAAFGRSLVVDPGRYTYSEAPDPVDGTNWRVHFRGTAAHNTVCVDGRNQTSYLPRAIKDASRHAPGSVRHKISGPAPEAGLHERLHGRHVDLLHGRAASHEYDAVHERCIVFAGRSYWIVSDWLRAPTGHDYTLKFQLGAHAHGATRLTVRAGVRCESPGLLLLQPPSDGPHGTCVQSAWVSARYGEKLAAPALCTTARGSDVDFDTVLVPWQHHAPAVRLDAVDALADGGDARALAERAGIGMGRGAGAGADDCATAAPRPRALRVTLEAAGARVTDHWFHARGRHAEAWRIGGFELRGRWVHWREGEAGQVLHATSHAGAELVDRRTATAVRIGIDRGARA